MDLLRQKYTFAQFQNCIHRLFHLNSGTSGCQSFIDASILSLCQNRTFEKNEMHN